jgi:hypothetical protein
MSDQQLKVLSSAVAVTKPGGYVFVTVPYEDKIPQVGHYTNFTKEMLLKLFDTLNDVFVIELDKFRYEYNMEHHFIFALKKSIKPREISK